MSETADLFTGVEVYGPIPFGASSAPLLREIDYSGSRAGFDRWASQQAEDPSILFVRGFLDGRPVGEWKPTLVAELRDGTRVYTGAAID